MWLSVSLFQIFVLLFFNYFSLFFYNNNNRLFIDDDGWFFSFFFSPRIVDVGCVTVFFTCEPWSFRRLRRLLRLLLPRRQQTWDRVILNGDTLGDPVGPEWAEVFRRMLDP